MRALHLLSQACGELILLHQHVVKGQPGSDPLVGSDIDAQHRSKDLLDHVILVKGYARVGARPRPDFRPANKVAMRASQHDGDEGFGFVPTAYQTRISAPLLHSLEDLLRELASIDREESRVLHALSEPLAVGNIHKVDLRMPNFMNPLNTNSPLHFEASGVRRRSVCE